MKKICLLLACLTLSFFLSISYAGTSQSSSNSVQIGPDCSPCSLDVFVNVLKEKLSYEELKSDLFKLASDKTSVIHLFVLNDIFTSIKKLITTMALQSDSLIVEKSDFSPEEHKIWNLKSKIYLAKLMTQNQFFRFGTALGNNAVKIVKDKSEFINCQQLASKSVELYFTEGMTLSVQSQTSKFTMLWWNRQDGSNLEIIQRLLTEWDEILASLERKALSTLALNIPRFYSDLWACYRDHIDSDKIDFGHVHEVLSNLPEEDRQNSILSPIFEFIHPNC